MMRQDYALRDIASEFFEFDDEAQIATIGMKFRSASDLFDEHADTRVPMMGEGFSDWLAKAFDYVPDRYQLALCVTVDDFEGYTRDELTRISLKNIELAAKGHEREVAATNRSALLLCILGFLFILAGIVVDQLWLGEGGPRDIVFFIMEIAATVPFWSAAETYFVDGGEERQNARNYYKRFCGITFHRADDGRA